MNNDPWAKISDALKIVKVARGTIVLARGEIANNAYRVTTGCLKSYVIDEAGKEHILQFAPEGWFITDIDSLFNEVPATLTIEAVEDSEVNLLGKRNLTEVLDFSNEDLLKHIVTLRNNIISINKRLVMLLSSTAEERYLDFMKTYPSLVKRLPLKLIASYVGITPEFLSRIRRKLAGRL